MRVVPGIIRACMGVVLAAAVAGPTLGAVDGLEIARAVQSTSLHWDNLGQSHRLVSGAPPAWDAALGLYVVDLRKGGVAIHVPAHAMLRVVATDAAAAPPVFAISNGTGLAIQRSPQRGVDGRSWLLRTGSARPSVIHILASDHKDSRPQKYAFFLARYEAPAEAAAYRREVVLPGPAVMVRRADQASPQTFVSIPAGDRISVQVRGPDRLLIEYRLAAPESPSTALPQLTLRLDGESAQVVRQPTGRETVAPVQVDGTWQASGRLERVALDVPAGLHTLDLQSTHGLLARAHTVGDADLLLPGLNAPPQWRGLEKYADLERLEQSSIAAAESNEWRDIGRLAGERLSREARLLPGQRSVQLAADELIGQFTQFQDLSPSTAGATRVRPVLLAEPQPPDEPVRHRIQGPFRNALGEKPELARFQRVSGNEIRFILPMVSYPLRVRALVDSASMQERLEVRDDVGNVSLLLPSMLRLPAPMMNFFAPQGNAEPLTPVAMVEWEVAPGARSLSVRSLAGELDMALQWAASTAYFLDDEYIAHRVSQGVWHENDAGTQQLNASRPFLRMLAAAHAQYVANVDPVRMTASRVGSAQDAQARRDAQAARSESEPVRKVALWNSALQAADPAVRSEALRGLAKALLAAGERFAAERILRSHWIGPDAALASVAQEELQALYLHEKDRAMQVNFSAAIASRDPSTFPALSALLAAEGEDRMALLAGLASTAPDLGAMTQSALRARLWNTFDALVQRIPEQRERQFWEAQRALVWGDHEKARMLFTAAGFNNWEANARDALALVHALQGEGQDRAAAVDAWSSWQARHPGPRVWLNEAESLVGHDGSLVLRNVPLNLRSQWWRASEAQPVVSQVVGPARVRIEARPLHREQASLLGGWLRVHSAGQLWLMPFHNNQPSPGLDVETARVFPGASVTREVDLPSGLHELRVEAGGVPIAARLLVERPALQHPGLAAPSPSRFQDQQGVEVRRIQSPQCGALQGCELLTGGAQLQANALRLEPFTRPGLPPPVSMRDPLAERLASGDIEGALALATAPLEQMRILLWMADLNPAVRPRALALGSRVAAAHPVAEIRSQWERLSEGSGWSVLPVVDRSAGLRRIEGLQGAPESPAGRIRAALLVPLRPGELRLGADTRATLVYQERQAVPLRLELAIDETPGLPTLPLTVSIERNGQPWQALQLGAASASRTVDLQLPPGEQTLSVSLRDPFANQFVRARFSGPVQPELTSTRDWHIATRSEPVRATLAGPVAVRIDHLGTNGIQSEERVLIEPLSTLVLAPLPGQPETLYRIHRRQYEPNAATALPPRPNAYQPQVMPEVPLAWKTPDEPALGEVHFIDKRPLALSLDHTLTVRGAVVRRRDTESTGGGNEDGPPAERFVEAGVSWRRRSEDGVVAALADALVRTPATGSPVLGLRLATEIQVPWHAQLPFPFTVDTVLTGFAQNTPDGLGVSMTARATVSQTREIFPTLSHTPAVGLVVRWLKLNAITDRSQVDTDVFTRYYATHPRALNFSETVSWRPWRDSHFTAALNIVTNPDFNPFRPDYVSGNLQWRQLMGASMVEAGLRTTRYRADGERAQGITRREWRLGAGNEWWLADGTRVELQAQLRHEAAAGVWGGLELRWHWSGGRPFRDFAPSAIDFRALRSWRAPATQNQIEER